MQEVAQLTEILEKADSGRFTKKETILLSESTRRALKYMLKQGIPITPKNFEMWFLVFLHLILQGDDEPTQERLDEAYLLINKHIKTSKAAERELNELKRATTEVLDLSYHRIDNILSHVKSYDDFLQERYSRLRGIEEDGTGVLIKTLLTQIEELREANRKLERELDQAKSAIKRLKDKLTRTVQEAKTDPLTGVFNKRYLVEELKRRLRLFESKGTSFAFIMTDIDKFKRVNDLYGHLAGDEVLIRFAKVLKEDLRLDDMVARYGGEEFAVVLHGLTEQEGVSVANRLRKRVEEMHISWGESLIRITASFGVAEAKHGDTPKTLIERADRALYLAKREGRNCVRSEKDLRARNIIPP